MGQVERADRALVPTGEEDPRVPSLDVPSREVSRAPSPRESVSTPPGASTPRSVSSLPGAAASSRRGEASRPGGAASRRGDVPSPETDVLSVPSQEAAVLSGPSPAAGDPIRPAAEDPILRAGEAPTHRAVGAIHRGAGGPSLLADEGPSPADPCRREVGRPPVVPWGGGSDSVPFLVPFSQRGGL